MNDQDRVTDEKLAELYPKVERHWRRYRHALEAGVTEEEMEAIRRQAWIDEEVAQVLKSQPEPSVDAAKEVPKC